MSSDPEPLPKRPKISLDPRKVELVLEKVLEVVSDVRTLVALSRVNKIVRSSVYRSNGLREIRYTATTDRCSVCSDFCAGLNGIHIAAGPNTEEKVNQGIRWLWTVGKGLKSLKIKLNRQYDDGKAPLPQLKLLALHGESRNIRRIKLRGAVYDEVLLFIYKYMDSLSDLSIDEVHLSPFSGSKLEFWKILPQCEQLQRLHIVLVDPEKMLPGDEETPKLFQLAFKASLRYLMIHFEGYDWHEHDCTRFLTQTVKCENLRKNLEVFSLCVGLSCFINTCCDYGPMQPFEKVVELQAPLHDFEEIDFESCFALFPALKKIRMFAFLPCEITSFSERFLNFFSSGFQETKIQWEIAAEGAELQQYVWFTEFFPLRGEEMPTERTFIWKLNGDVFESIVLKKGNATLELRFKVWKYENINCRAMIETSSFLQG